MADTIFYYCFKGFKKFLGDDYNGAHLRKGCKQKFVMSFIVDL